MRHQTIDTAGVLANVAQARANGTPDRVREAEVAKVRAWWPDDAVDDACQYGAAWHAMTEPPRWDVDLAEMLEFVYWMIDRKRRWPTIDEQRRRFGKLPTDRLPGEVEGQATLL